MTAIQMLKEKDIRPSVIRIMVLEYLMENRVHPVAEEVYEALVEKVPTLSKTSVYNTLNLLSDKGVISAVTIDPSKVRFDADITTHGHFKCSECKNVWDFPIEKLETVIPFDFDVKREEVYFTGLCTKCKKN